MVSSVAAYYVHLVAEGERGWGRVVWLCRGAGLLVSSDVGVVLGTVEVHTVGSFGQK